MTGLAHDLRYALRMLGRNPAIAAIAILALGLGIGANTAVFTVLNGVLLRPLPFPEADRLLLFSNTPRGGPFGTVLGLTESDYLELRRNDHSFEPPAAFNGTQVSLTGVGEAVRLPAANVTPDLFTVLRVNPAMGRDFRPEEAQAAVVLLSDAIWRSRFHTDPHIVGQVIKLDGVATTVIGVMAPGFSFPSDAQVWTPLDVRVDPHRAFFRPTVARLKPGATRQQAQAEFAAFAQGLADAVPASRRRNAPVPQVLPLKELLVSDVRDTLRIFAGAVAFVLLIACANVANLLLMRAESRKQEIAVRIALGAGGRRLARQLLTESLLVSVLGGAVGILLALWGVPALLALAPKDRIPRLPEISIDSTVLAFTLAVSILTGLLFGAAPAFQAVRRTVRDRLNQGARISGAGGGLRNALAVGEIALALVLLMGAGLMLKSLWRLRAVDPGFRADHVLTMTVTVPESVYRQPADIQAFHERVLAKLGATRGVAAVAAVNYLPLGGMLARGDFQVERGKFPPNYAVDKLVVSPSYFRTMGIRLLNGRDFSERDRDGTPKVTIISQSAARAIWPGEDPLGKRISEADHPSSADWYTIIGVVDDVRQLGLTMKASPALYFSYLQSPHAGWLPHMTFVLRTEEGTQQIAPAMRAAVREVDADQPVERAISMPDLIATTGAERTFQARLLAAFAALALLLAAIGVYGVLAYGVAMRTREIGIRIALGARTADVLRMVMRRTAVLAVCGLALGTVASLFATRVLEKMLFEVKPHDGATMLAGACVLGAAALAAGWVPARRAARVDPLVALRWE
ncbi:MAG TPA: ABC transporter permease [Bryobacteraceae bacterium]